jgi:hypothetical protein
MRSLTQLLTVFAFVVAASPASAQQDKSSEGSSRHERRSSIGYPSVVAAFEALRARRDVKITVERGWTIVIEPRENSVWSFTPIGHPAHPAAVKRSAIEKEGAISINMRVLCRSGEAACDKLVAEFKVLNNKLRDEIERAHRVKPVPRLRSSGS